MSSYDDVVAFLSSPGIVDSGVPHLHTTHIAHVFVGQTRALKIKRPVKLAFLDFSTLEKRHAACLSEIAVNRTNAPEIYIGVVAITREADGRLAIGGGGVPVEWAVEMRAFRDDDLLAERARQGPLDPALMRQTADAIAAMHARAKPEPAADAVAKMLAIVAEVGGVCGAHSEVLEGDAVAQWMARARCAVDDAAPLLRARVAAGAIRRCHGDLHLANIVIWQGRPTLFDALEFSEEMATVDTLYDLAFLMMDLVHHGQRAAANTILNRYLWRTGGRGGETDDIDGLRLMPLYLSCRAGIRAMVAATRVGVQRSAAGVNDVTAGSDGIIAQARGYLRAALDLLEPTPPRLIAVGGLSGSGKSTLAAALAPLVGGPLGALHLRSDLERKAMMGIDETDRLPPEHYTPESAACVYQRVLMRAQAAVTAGQSVIVDAVFATAQERRRLTSLAAAANVPFSGLWLEADADTLRRRVDERRDDASDATRAVVDRQLGYDIGPLDEWQRVKAGGTPGDTLQAARRALGLP